MNALKNYKVLGYTTDFTTCECCGKQNLKGTVSMLHLDSQVVCHFGSVCAGAIDKYDTLEAAAKAKKEVNNAVAHYKTTIRFAWGIAWSLLRKKYGWDAANVAPVTERDALISECEQWYTAAENKFKPFPKREL